MAEAGGRDALTTEVGGRPDFHEAYLAAYRQAHDLATSQLLKGHPAGDVATGLRWAIDAQWAVSVRALEDALRLRRTGTGPDAGEAVRAILADPPEVRAGER